MAIDLSLTLFAFFVVVFAATAERALAAATASVTGTIAWPGEIVE